MLHKVRIVLNNLFDYLVIGLLLILSIVLVLPFPSIFVGVVHYFERKMDDRRLGDIFAVYRDNWPILMKFSFYIVIAYAVSIADIAFLRRAEIGYVVINIIGYTVLILATTTLINGPMLILHMNLNFRQLLFNSFMLIFGKWWLFLITIIIYAGVAVLCIFFPYVTPIFPVILAALTSYSTRVNFRILKKKVLSKRGEKETEEETDENQQN